MKSIVKIFAFLLIALITVCAVSATSNDKLPQKEEVTTFLTEMKGTSASDILDKVKTNHPTWNADLIECPSCSGDKEAIALYYTDSGSKGYGSIYYNGTAIVSPADLKGFNVKDAYKGELEKSENSTEDNSSKPEEDKVIKVENATEHTYNDLSEFLDDYDGSKQYSQENVDSLQDAFLKAGWNTEIRYCIAVNTSDEGFLHIVLGA